MKPETRSRVDRSFPHCCVSVEEVGRGGGSDFFDQDFEEFWVGRISPVWEDAVVRLRVVFLLYVVARKDLGAGNMVCRGDS